MRHSGLLFTIIVERLGQLVGSVFTVKVVKIPTHTHFSNLFCLNRCLCLICANKQ